MCEKNDLPNSGNAVNQPWPAETVRELAEIDAPRYRAEQFRDELEQRLPSKEQTDMMLHIASAMAQMGNGPDSIWVYTGHPEEARNPPREKPSHSVIERLGHIGIPKYTSPPRSTPIEEVIREISKVYRHSPVCHPPHQNIPLRTLEADVRGILKLYGKI